MLLSLAYNDIDFKVLLHNLGTDTFWTLFGTKCPKICLNTAQNVTKCKMCLNYVQATYWCPKCIQTLDIFLKIPCWHAESVQTLTNVSKMCLKVCTCFGHWNANFPDKECFPKTVQTKNKLTRCDQLVPCVISWYYVWPAVTIVTSCYHVWPAVTRYDQLVLACNQHLPGVTS